MAGSPGSGKTEFSESFLEQLLARDSELSIFLLDTDELREHIPGYTGSNSDEVQAAATILFEKVFDFLNKNKINAIVDTTFASPNAIKNVERALNRKRKVGIIYLYQDPLVAWDYTKKREVVEGRIVPKSVFISAYFESKKNVLLAKKQFGKRIELHVFEKDENNSFSKRAHFNVNNFEGVIQENYTKEKLEDLLSDTI